MKARIIFGFLKTMIVVDVVIAHLMLMALIVRWTFQSFSTLFDLLGSLFLLIPLSGFVGLTFLMLLILNYVLESHV